MRAIDVIKTYNSIENIISHKDEISEARIQ